MRKPQVRLWPTLATLLGLAILLALGTWQLGRYQEKLKMEAQRDARATLEPLPITSLDAIDAQAHGYRLLRITGTLDNARSVLFKHRQLRGRPGYWLATPLVLEGGQAAIIVNRGWLPRAEAEDVAQRLIAEPATQATYTGLLHVLDQNIPDEPKRASLKQGALTLEGQLTQWSSYDLEAIQGALPYRTPAQPMALVLDASHSGDPLPISSVAYLTTPYMTSDRHLGYMAFWYTTALMLVGMYVGAAFGLISSKGPRPAPAQPKAPGDAPRA